MMATRKDIDGIVVTWRIKFKPGRENRWPGEKPGRSDSSCNRRIEREEKIASGQAVKACQVSIEKGRRLPIWQSRSGVSFHKYII